MTITELERRAFDFDGEVSVQTHCRGCGREIPLWFNGGELDIQRCCGFEYELEHRQIDFVVRGSLS